jgi:hypothetical protein
MRGNMARHERDTRTTRRADHRTDATHIGYRATATPGPGETAAALHGGGLGGDRCRRRLHPLVGVLRRCVHLEAPTPLPASPRHVSPRRPRTGQWALGARRPQRRLRTVLRRTQWPGTRQRTVGIWARRTRVDRSDAPKRSGRPRCTACRPGCQRPRAAACRPATWGARATSLMALT